MKVKNLIQRLEKQYKVEEINIITPSRVLFSDSCENWKVLDVW